MIHRVLGIGRWVIDFLFAVDGYDIDGVLSCLYEIDAPDSVIWRSIHIIEGARFNRGFTYSNENMRRAVVVIGPTTSGKQFQNTVVHELRHVIDAIANSLGLGLGEEAPAYMSGDTAMELFDIICTLGCEHCRGKLLPLQM